MNKYIELGKGNCPLILLSFHDGDMSIDGPERENEMDNISNNNLIIIKKKQIKNRDCFCNLLLDNIVNNFKTKNMKPYFIKNNISRKFLDLNRNMQYGFNNNNELARFYYFFFHWVLLDFIFEIKKQFNNKCLIFDIHGNRYNGLIQIGYNITLSEFKSKNFKNNSIPTIFEQKDYVNYLLGKYSFSKYLNDYLTNYTIFPNFDMNGYINYDIINNKIFYNGGYITDEYNKYCDIIQIELAKDFRFNDKESWNLLSNAIYKYFIEIYNNLK